MKRKWIDYSKLKFTECANSSYTFTCSAIVQNINPYNWGVMTDNIKKCDKNLPENIEIVEIVWTKNGVTTKYKMNEENRHRVR